MPTSSSPLQTAAQLPMPVPHKHHGEDSAVAHETKANATTAMRADGFYNKHSQQQAAALQVGLEVLREAVADVPASAVVGRGWVTFCDFGASQGRNSIPPSREFVDAMLRRGARAVHVVHQDLPTNDFNSLIRLLHTDEGYTAGRDNVFTMATGGDFHQRVMADESLAVGWSSTSCNWLTKPSPLRGAFVNVTADPATTVGYEETVRLAADDWERYVKCREAELVVGGQLVQVEVARDEAGSCAAEGYFHAVRAALVDALGEESADLVSVPMYIRNMGELTAPFRSGAAPSLRLRETRFVTTPDALLAVYRANGDLDAHCERMVAVFKAAIVPSLKLDRFAPDKVDAFYRNLAEGVRRDPEACTVGWNVVVLRAEKLAPLAAVSPKSDAGSKSPLARFNPFRRRS